MSIAIRLIRLAESSTSAASTPTRRVGSTRIGESLPSRAEFQEGSPTGRIVAAEHDPPRRARADELLHETGRGCTFLAPVEDKGPRPREKAQGATNSRIARQCDAVSEEPLREIGIEPQRFVGEYGAIFKGEPSPQGAALRQLGANVRCGSEESATKTDGAGPATHIVQQESEAGADNGRRTREPARESGV